MHWTQPLQNPCKLHLGGWLWYNFSWFSCVWVPTAFAHSNWPSMCLGFLLLAAIKLTHSEDSSTFSITLNYAVCWSCSPTLAIMLLMHVALHAPLTLGSVIAWVLHYLSRCPMPSNMPVNLLISSALSCPYGFHCILPRLMIFAAFSPSGKCFGFFFSFSCCANQNEI